MARTTAFSLLGSLALIINPNPCLGEQAMQERNLARLDERTPGASRAVAWTTDGGEAAAPGLADGDRKSPAELPKDWAAVGVVWPIAHVADRVEVFFAARPPAPGSLAVQAFDGREWADVRDGLKAEVRPTAGSIRFAFEPVASRRIRVLAKRVRPAVCELAVHPYTPRITRGRIAWPKRMVTRDFEEHMLARKEEPSFESLSLHGLSMPVWAMMGIKDWPHEQAVSWDGRILAPLFKISCRVGEPPKGFADVRDTVRRGLIDGWLPGVTVEGQFGQVKVTQTSFVAFTDAEQTRPGLFLRYDVSNVSDRPCKTVLRVGLEWDDGKTRAEFRDGALVRGKAVYLVCHQPCRGGASPNSIGCEVDLAPGEARRFTLAAAVNYRGSASRPISQHLRKAGYDDALGRFRSYWSRLLRPTMKLNLPEPRLNDMYKAVLAQLFINADRDVMPYGAMPSRYDGKLYGVEEGYAMMVLAMSGLSGDAQRYMDGTYLTRPFLKKVTKYRGYGDRHQQYRNGLQPTYAVQAFRFSRDRKWIAKHVPLLVECAEWTIANRRKTMTPAEGDRPLHWGLLPKWSYGGDLAEQQCYPLYANLACWRGMTETAWLMEALGDREKADRYAAEARDYRRVIEAVIDRIYRADADPPVLPPHVYAKGPEGGEYYQLFAGCILDLLPFEFGDKKANFLSEFLERDNRTFCLLPRFRRDVAGGGLDALYGLGYILTKLHQDRIREFLLGFYAFCVFDMEHTCFTSRETNAIYASDRHLRTRFAVPEMSDPLPCSSAVALLLLRHMLLTEDSRGAGEYTGGLLLLFGAPRRWFRHGETIEVAAAPSHFGKVSFRVRSRADEGVIEAEVAVPKPAACRYLKLRLRHPRGLRFKGVLVNGREHGETDARAELIRIDAPAGSYRIEARY